MIYEAKEWLVSTLGPQKGKALFSTVGSVNLSHRSDLCLLSSNLRTYKNGFVWHDLSEKDFIFPVHGQEYVLKGSQILDLDNNSGKEYNFSVVTHRRNQSWSSIDQYKVYKASDKLTTSKLATDASTQTDDHRRRKHIAKEVNEITELSREEITSPPQSDSSPETLESLMKADGRLRLCLGDQESSNRTLEKMRPSAVLMQLISCGAMSFKKCAPTLMNGSTRSTVERVTGNYRLERAEKELRSFGRVKLEEKEYFSGSLIDESKKELVPALMRSSSCNADRMGLTKEKDGEEVARASFIPRNPKPVVDSHNKAKAGV